MSGLFNNRPCRISAEGVSAPAPRRRSQSIAPFVVCSAGGSAQLSRGGRGILGMGTIASDCCGLVFGQGQGRLQLSNANLAVYRFRSLVTPL